MAGSWAGERAGPPHLTTLTGSTQNWTALRIEALAGGRLGLGGLTEIRTGQTSLLADGAGSVLNVSPLVSWMGYNTGYACSLEAKNGGSVLSGSLAMLNTVTINYDGTGMLELPSLSSAMSTNILVTSGTLSLPSLTAYAAGDVGGAVTLRAQGAGSVLAIPNLTQELDGEYVLQQFLG